MQQPSIPASPQQQIPSHENPTQVQASQSLGPAAQSLTQVSTGSQQQQGPQQQQQQLATPLFAGAVSASAAVAASLSSQAAVLAPAAPPAVGTAGLGNINQPLAALMDVSSGEFAKLIRNPAAYSADAINKLSSSVSNTMSSLLAQGQHG